MNAHRRVLRFGENGADAVFPTLSVAMFAASYPEGAHELRHNLGPHPLLELEALAQLGEALPETSVECYRADLPTGADAGPAGSDLPIGEAIRGIDQSCSWTALNNIERVPAYAALLDELLGELHDEILAQTGKIHGTQGSVFISSPGAVAPFRFDPGHGILLQLVGDQAMTVFPAGNSLCALDAAHESVGTGSGRDLSWRDEFLDHGVTFRLEPGEAVYVPVRAPHHARTGAEPSISLSITWGSEWSLAEADARALNRLLRDWGFDPRPPRRWPARNRIKSIAWRSLQQLPGIN
jgi:hypothetical protein